MTTGTPELTAPPAPARAGAHRAVRPRRSSHVVSKTVVNLVLLLIAACFVVPLLWVVLAAFNESATLSVTWPAPWSLGNFEAVLDTDTRQTIARVAVGKVPKRVLVVTLPGQTASDGK